MNRIRKILVANRGEIALRIMRTARKLGIPTVAVYSLIDADALHVAEAEEAWCIGEAELSETYLNIPGIIETARRAGCDAIHPGYGFLAENPLFVEACTGAGITFIGPDARVMRIMGNKIEARDFVKKTGVPVTEGLTGTKKDLLKAASRIGLPVLIKAAAGGGGKGMQIVYDEKQLPEAIESASRQALAYFSDETVYIEKYLEEPLHIEIQVLGDHHGNVIHLFERECSIQRRYQKIIEESPSPTLTPELRQRMGEAAVRIAKEIGYTSAGTIEFLVDRKLHFYFLEMNTRIQVEHPVTELVTGIDIVEEQIRIASGNPLRLRQEEIRQHGHAIECRIYAEDPENNFRPSPGTMTLYREPELPGVRVDAGVDARTEIKTAFDPMISKLVAWGADREEARLKSLEALQEYIIHGIRCNISYLSGILRENAFIENTISTSFCDLHTEEINMMSGQLKKEIPGHIPLAGYLISTMSEPDHFPGEDGNPWKKIGFWRDMISLRVDAGGLEYLVPVRRNGNRDFEFSINGMIIAANLNSREANRLSFTAGGIRHVIWFSEDAEGGCQVTLNGNNFFFRRKDRLEEMVPAPSPELPGHHGNEVFAPMPGKIIRIQVKEGEKVRKGHVLMIMEAMKMENAILAPRDATVEKINVGLNARVEVSTPLVILEMVEKKT
jgi:acetyl-CoA carboxylase biotin carboxylase subunit